MGKEVIIREYKSNLTGQITIAIILGLLVESILGVMLLSRGFVIEIVISMLVIPALLFALVLIYKLDVRVTDYDIQFIKFGRPINSIPFENNKFEEYVLTIYIPRGMTFTIKFLRVIDCNGEARKYSCNALSDRVFSRLISDVIRISMENNHRKLSEEALAIVLATSTGSEAANMIKQIESVEARETEKSEEPFDEAVFIFPKEIFRATLNKNSKKNIIRTVLAVSLFALVYTGFSMLLTTEYKGMLKALLFFVLFTFGILGIINFVIWVKYQAKLNKTPDYIRITKNELFVDHCKFLRSDIEMIRMTQENFIACEQHRLRLLKINAAGKNNQYLLGHMNIGARQFCYEDYGRLCSSLNDFLRQSGRSVIFEAI